MHATPRQSPVAFKGVDCLTTALCFGLLSGLVEAGWLLGRKALAFQHFLFLHQEFIWMTPVANAVVFLAIGLVLFALSPVLPEKWLQTLTLFLAVFGFMLVALLTMAKQIHWLANVVLAFGIASGITRKSAVQLTNWLPSLRRTTGLLVGLQAVVALAFLGKRVWMEQQQLNSLPQARKTAPNVIVMTWDTVRAKNTSLHGYHRDTTPHLKRWAEKGVCFRNALSAAPWTLPAHATMFTGHYPQESTASWLLPMDNRHATLAEVLRDQGYETAGFIANRGYTGYETGLDRGFIRYEGHSFAVGEFINCSLIARRFFDSEPVRRVLRCYEWYGHITAEHVNYRFNRWLDGRCSDRPFFVFLNYFDAHDPYVSPAPFNNKFGPPRTGDDMLLMHRWLPQICNLDAPPPPEIAAKGLDFYDGGIAYQDHCLNDLLNSLEQRGELDNTIVIITADHGEHFGEHGFYMHGHTLYRDLVHVPLVVLFGNRLEAGAAIDRPVTLRDLSATVLELAEAKDRTALPGRSWFANPVDSADEVQSESPLLQIALLIPDGRIRPAAGRSPVAGGNVVSLLWKGKYYIRNLETGIEELYDFHRDVTESYDLAKLPDAAEVLIPFRNELKRVMEKHENLWDLQAPAVTEQLLSRWAESRPGGYVID